MKNSPQITLTAAEQPGESPTGPGGTVLVCPYCGEVQPQSPRCRTCAGLFEPYSRLATHNAMGPWFVRQPQRPFHPGCSYQTLVKMIERGQVSKTSIVRGPTTRQFWEVARRVPGISHLFGCCHNCEARVEPSDHGCHACGVPFGAYLDRNFLGLPDVQSLPWEAGVDEDDFSDRAFGKPQSVGDPAHASPLPATTGDDPVAGPSVPRLSAFASNSELMAAPINPDRPPLTDRTPATGDTGLAAASIPASRSPSASGPPHPPAVPADLATRSLRRQIRRQQNTMRWLWLLLGVFAIGLLTMVFMLWNRVAPL